MNYFYRVAITKQSVGSAIEHKEPPLSGQIQAKVTDATTQGDFKLIIVEGDETQHRFNLNLPGVQHLEEDEVTQLAPLYQPQRTIKRFDPKTRQEEQVVMPAADLTRFYVAKPAVEKATKPGRVGKSKALPTISLSPVGWAKAKRCPPFP